MEKISACVTFIGGTSLTLFKLRITECSAANFLTALRD